MTRAARWARSRRKPRANISSRVQAQDDYAIARLTRAQDAQKSGAFDREIVAVEVTTRKGTETGQRRRTAGARATPTRSRR